MFKIILMHYSRNPLAAANFTNKHLHTIVAPYPKLNQARKISF